MRVRMTRAATTGHIKSTVKERDGYRCQDCGISEEQHIRDRQNRGLEVHRVIPGSPYSVAGCITLCLACHDKRPTERHVKTAEALMALQDVLPGYKAPCHLDDLRHFPNHAKALTEALARLVSEKTGKHVSQSALLYALVSRECVRLCVSGD